jgi:WYL_2, Sm-like SH3 beta-barrel fold
MKTLDLVGETVQERGIWLRNVLTKNICDVTFTKVNGETRTMPCTLKPSSLPPAPVKESKKVANPETMSVWCVDKKEWRSFKTMNVTEVRVL